MQYNNLHEKRAYQNKISKYIVGGLIAVSLGAFIFYNTICNKPQENQESKLENTVYKLTKN